MLRISKMADYAVVILSSMAKSQGVLQSASAIAFTARLPEPTVAKLLKLLVPAGFVESARGAQGGYKLIKSCDEISVGQIIEAVDGPVSLTACVENSHESCELESVCSVKGRWDDVNFAIQNALAGVSLSDMMAPPDFINKKNMDMARQAKG